MSAARHTLLPYRTSRYDPRVFTTLGLDATWDSVRPGTLRGFKTVQIGDLCGPGTSTSWGAAPLGLCTPRRGRRGRRAMHLVDVTLPIVFIGLHVWERKRIADPVPTIGPAMRYKDRLPYAVIADGIALVVTSGAKTI